MEECKLHWRLVCCLCRKGTGNFLFQGISALCCHSSLFVIISRGQITSNYVDLQTVPSSLDSSGLLSVVHLSFAFLGATDPLRIVEWLKDIPGTKWCVATLSSKTHSCLPLKQKLSLWCKLNTWWNALVDWGECLLYSVNEYLG